MDNITHLLHIEHQVTDFATWKRHAFDADPVGRARMHVRGHRVARAADDPSFVMIDLEFDNRDSAEAMQAALRELWGNPLVQIGSPRARVVELVEVV